MIDGGVVPRALAFVIVTVVLTAFGWMKMPVSATEPPSKLSASERALFNKRVFKPILKVKMLPVSVLDLLGVSSSQASASSDSLADPEQAFEVGCTVSGKLPRRRLIFAGTDSERCVICYEQGGRSHFFCIYVFDLAEKPVAVLAKANTSTRIANIEELKTAVAKKIVL